MVYTSLVAVLCLAVCVASKLRETDGRGPGVGSPDDTVSVDEHHEKQRIVTDTRSFSHPPASGLAELMHRMMLFSHGLNHSKEKPIDRNENNFEGEGLTELVQRIILFSHALNLTTTKSLNGSSDETRVYEGMVGLVRSMLLLSHSLNLSAEFKGSSEDENVHDGMIHLVDIMMLFSHALTLSRVQPTFTGDQRLKKGLTDFVDMMTLHSYALNRSSDGATEYVDGGKEGRVLGGLADLINRMVLFSYALNRSIDDSTGKDDNNKQQIEREGLGELMHIMFIFSLALNTSDSEHKHDIGSGDEKQTVNVGLVEFIKRMRLLSEVLTDDHTQLLRFPASSSDLGTEDTSTILA